MATHTLPSWWEQETPENILTAIYLINEANERNTR